MPNRSDDSLQLEVGEISRLLEKHRILDTLAHRQEGRRRDLVESLQHRQNLVELRRRVQTMHAADISFLLEALPFDDRTIVWEQLTSQQAAQVLVEVPSAVREHLLAITPHDTLVASLLTLDPEDLAFVADDLDAAIRDDVSRALESADREVFDQASSYDEDSVGRYMTREWVALPETHTIQQALADLRARGALPAQTDRIFVVDVRNVLRGTLALPTLVLTDPTTPVVAAMSDENVVFRPHEHATDAAKAFERYDLVSAPVVDERGKLVGRLTVDSVLDFVRDQANLSALNRAGLSGDEDLFASPWQSARNRWPWLAVNLVTAFLASRVIGQFETQIQTLASLAALMPIVASIGGNTGNQTMALVIRGLALERIQVGGARRMIRKELAISLLNGLVWGAVVGLLAVAIYSNLALGVVMSAAVVLNLVVAAVTGVGVPFALLAAGRDPAHGSSVLLTFITDAMGFLLFLGLATIFLL